MTYYLKHGAFYTPTNEANMHITKEVPAGVYMVHLDPKTEEFYLEISTGFSVPDKLYGNTTRWANRIIKSFEARPDTTGALFSGEKGSGKTLLAKVISTLGNKAGYPTIIINQPHRGTNFNKLIQGMTQPAIILFDEFEKVYDTRQQEEILTLMDGVFPSKKLFLITCNDQWRINEHMRNRPGRILYSIDYRGLNAEFIKEYCTDNLNNHSNINGVIKYASLFEEFNFDMLKAMVEEMNRFNEDAAEAVEILNAKPINETARTVYDISITNKEGKTLPKNSYYPTETTENPVSKKMVEITITEDINGEDLDNEIELRLTSNELMSLETLKGIAYSPVTGYNVLYTPRERKKFSYSSLII